MSARGRWVITHRAPLVLVRGWGAGETLSRYGFHAPYSGLGKGWVVSDNYLDDIGAVASLETRGYRLIHEDGDDCECATPPNEKRERFVDPSACDCSDLGPLPEALLDLGVSEIEHWHRRTYARGWSA